MSDDLNSVKKNLNGDQIGARSGRYHHGDLRAALIAAGEDILAERGVEGFSLREAARRAGVSPAAPAHHFGDARGLLTVIAARGFERLTETMAAGAKGKKKAAARVRALGQAYVAFAHAHPAHFNLMWRRTLLDNDDPALQAAAGAAFAMLEEAVTGAAGGHPKAPAPSVVAAWSIVHGYALLILDGAMPDPGAAYLDKVLDRLLLTDRAD
jgi:AcrR family transcriptional regulator